MSLPFHAHHSPWHSLPPAEPVAAMPHSFLFNGPATASCASSDLTPPWPQLLFQPSGLFAHDPSFIGRASHIFPVL